MLPSARVLSAQSKSIPPTIRTLLGAVESVASPNSAQTGTTVHGWVRSVRGHKNVAFAEIDDGSGSVLQAVLKGKGKADGLTQGSSVRLEGKLVSSRGSGQKYELVVDNATILGPSDDSYPIQKAAMTAPYLREHAHLRFKTTQTASVMRLRDALVRDWHDWLEENEFVHIHTPILTSSDCEGAGETFTIAQSLPTPAPKTPVAPGAEPTPPFFPSPVNLTVSGQLHIEGPTHALSRAYTLSPAFRAEPSQTSRHLCEFYMLELEVGFVTSLNSLLDLAEESFRGVLQELLTSNSRRAVRAREDLERIASHPHLEHEGDIPSEPRDPLAHLISTAESPFARITYTEAIDVLKEQHAKTPFEHPPAWSDGLASEHEKWLAGQHFKRPTFVTDYPADQKPFYMLPSDAASDAADRPPAPGPTVACFDLLFPGIGEMAGGSLREHRLDALTASMEKHGLKPEDYSWYLDLRRYGSIPHGGWGMGWERWVNWVSGVANIRDVVAFPRWAGSCRF